MRSTTTGINRTQQLLVHRADRVEDVFDLSDGVDDDAKH